jgi:GNAT superfamily N-acetyltransferase
MILTLLILDPRHQRRGIGSMFFEDGLRVADEAGLQVILGASTQGVGLYKKYGRVEIYVMKTNLWEYEGGEDLGVTTNSMLRKFHEKVQKAS